MPFPDRCTDAALFALRALGVVGMGTGQPLLASHLFNAFLRHGSKQRRRSDRASAGVVVNGDVYGVDTPVWFMLARCCEQAMDLRGAVHCLRCVPVVD